MKVYFERKVLGGFFLALSILTVLGIYSYRNNQDSITSERMISRSNEVLYHIKQLHTTHLEIESELLRYTINADTTFLSFYHSRIKAAAEHFTTLSNLTQNDSSQKMRMDTLLLLGRQKVALIMKIIAARQHSRDSVRTLIPSAYNLSLSNRINAGIEAMQNEEIKLLDQRIEANQKEGKKFNSTFSILLICTGIIIIVLFLTINASLRARLLIEQALKLASEEIKDLYNNAPCGYHSLNENGVIVQMNETWLKWIGYESEEVINKLKFGQLLTPKSLELFEKSFPLFKSQGFVNNLEYEIRRKNSETFLIILNATAINDADGNFIKSRSTAFDITGRHKTEQKLTEANKELEAFTYSVSHDLRAPLRSIDGYSKILQEDYGSNLGEEPTRLLQIVRNNARKMGHLIDDLLDFSRVGRKDLARNKMDMNALVDHVKQQLMVSEKNREIRFTVHPLKAVNADSTMIRQVWVNLISNALKYTRNVPVAEIEIGCLKENSQVVYYIRDNGVGFDMKYVNKLFGVFQRLHKIEEFDGTGVGLALVHRIVTRHGGRVWAEGRINQGATFFFCIPTLNLN